MISIRYICILCSFFIWSCKSSVSRHNDNEILVKKIIDSAIQLGDHNKTEQAFRFVDSSFAKIKNPGIGDEFERLNFFSRAYYHVYLVQDNKAILNKAEIYADSTISLIENSNDIPRYWKQLNKSYIFKGDISLEKKQYSLTYQWFFKAKRLSDKFGTPYDKSEFNARLASLNYAQKRYQTAAKYYVSQYNELQKCDPNIDIFMRTQGALDNAGLSYSNSAAPDSALIYYVKAIAYINSNEPKYPKNKAFMAEAKAVIYKNIGNLYKSSFNYEKALNAYTKSIDLFKKFTNSPEYILSSELELAGLYLKMANYNACNQILNKHESEITKPDGNKLLWYELKIDYLYKTKSLKDVHKYIVEYAKVKADSDKEFRNASSENINQKFYDLQKEYELNLLKKENQLSNLYLIIAIGFTIMALFILYQIWRNWKATKKNNNTLILLNKQVTEQNLHLQNTLTALEQSQEDNKRVMKVVAHDLRSPIGAIVSLAGFMLSDNRLQGEDQHLMELIQNSGSDSLKFVNELLNRESTVNEMERDPVDLNALLHYCVNLLQYKATEKRQKIILKSIPVTLSLNREKIWRVMSNLITNAVKFSPESSIIDVNVSILKDSVLISVRDSGIGIPDHIKEKIFDINEEAKRTGTKGEKSFGMGLIISKQIIEAHKGKLWFNSIENKGTTFFVELPLL